MQGMNRFPFLFFLLLIFSCTPDGKFDEKYDGDTTIVVDQPVDTFSVKRAKSSTSEGKTEITGTQSKTDSVTGEITTIVKTDDAGNSAIILNPDIAPSFPGGSPAMDAFIAKRKIYPLVAFQNDVKGTVMIKFVVERDGKIDGIKVVQGLGYGCDESATDLVRNMPKWTPGQKNGIAVRCSVTLPVSFGN
jgi:protein TonB